MELNCSVGLGVHVRAQFTVPRSFTEKTTPCPSSRVFEVVAM